jgi:SAM-dependent methyltransferase
MNPGNCEKSIKCPNCGERILKVKYRIKNNVYACNKCKLQFCLDAKFDNEFDSSIDIENWETSLNSLRKQNYKKILDYLIEQLPQNSPGLDVGCGSGLFLLEGKKYGFSMFGIEPEPERCEKCAIHNLNVTKGFFPDNIDKNLSYDFIIFNDSFEHIKDIEKTVIASRELLKDNGLMVVSIPVSSGAFYRISELMYHLGIKSFLNRLWQFNFFTPHYYYFNDFCINDFAEKYEFDCIKTIILETLDCSSVNKRISLGNSAKSNVFISIAVKILYPVLKLFPRDSKCFIFKKHIMTDKV